ncbi:hypothetical protein Salmuc_04402 [Salipiger mucosus DSM 16094]|uniref:Glycosyltransferase RgtA/B/C/D-like domain-containing protein n=2 Tax=Salipiger mucosus TaxID=263378 RepID=S9RXV4_9RHOB|nr:hypothetical protein Salmuc_04402 [Salipiger mucosus DSM 16094]
MVLFMAMALVVAKAVLTASSGIEGLAQTGNDDIMRFLSVRDWLAGQAWFDTRQYRMVPPEGLDLHWSRFVDAAIGGLVRLGEVVVSTERAEVFALVAWPTLLFLGLIAATGLAARRVLGSRAALVSVMALLLWPPTGATFFAPMHVDHHNIQMLLTAVTLITLVVPGPAGRLGAIGGAASAMSLAVGLEMMPAIGLAGIVLLCQTVFLTPGRARQLGAFSVTLALVAAVLFAGQTAPDEWMATRCDELSMPYLALASAGALCCLAVAAMAGRVPNGALRGVAALVLVVLAVALVYPVVRPCLVGPYGDLPQRVQDVISMRIAEARPALPALLAGDTMAVRFVFPALMAAALASALWVLDMRRRAGGAETRRRVGILLLFGWLGVIGSLFQIRLVMLGAAAFPFLCGYLVEGVLRVGKARGAGRGARLALVPVLALTLLSPALYSLATSLAARAGSSMGPAQMRATDASCRTPDVLRSLNTVPSGAVLSTSNLGAPLLLLTHHMALAGPYHRSPEAMADGVLPFEGDEAQMRAALRRTGADYLLLCRDAVYGDGSSFATGLAAGEGADGLEAVAGPDPALVLLEVSGRDG